MKVPELDLTGWVKILDWGYNAKVYRRSNDRVMIERKTGRVIIRYEFRKTGELHLHEKGSDVYKLSNGI